MDNKNTNTATKQADNKQPETKQAKALQFGSLKEVSIEEIWKDGQNDFGEWFAANYKMMADALDLEIADVVKKGNGDFTATLGKGKTNVCIESQLMQTTNNNLGRILAHAAGQNAGVVIWIVSNARDEHRNALKMINGPGKPDFYLIELHAFKIGDTMCAAQFDAVVKP